MNAGGEGCVWFQQVSVGLSEWGTREWTFSSLLLVRAQGKMGEFRLFWPRSEGENVVIGSPRRPASVGAKCAQFAAAGSFHTATYTMYNRCASLSLLLCLRGGWSGADFRPVVCERGGGRKTALWLDDMLGDTLLNCFDCCAAKVTIKKPLSAKIYIMISSRLNIDVMYTMLRDDSMVHPVCVCVCGTYRCSLVRVTVPRRGKSDLYSDLFTVNETRLSLILHAHRVRVTFQIAWVGHRSPMRLHLNWDFLTCKTFFIDLQVLGNANKVVFCF